MEKARAQEAAPVPLSLVFDADGSLVAARLRSAGLALRADAGGYRLLCASALSVPSSLPIFAGKRPTTDGYWVAHYRGIQTLDANGCHPQDIPTAFAGQNAADVDRHGSDIYALLTRIDGVEVVRSNDGGATFESAFSPPQDLTHIAMRRAPSDPQRFYLLALQSDPITGEINSFLVRTGDGGDSFQREPLDVSTELPLSIIQVDPDDPDRLYLADAKGVSGHSHADEAHIPERVHVSEDGGRTFRELITMHVLGGFAVGDEPGELWVGEGTGGLLRSTDGGETFETVQPDLHVSCLEQRGDRLFVCADATSDPFSVGYTTDDGATLEPVMHLSQVSGVVSCDGRPLSACRVAWAGLAFWSGNASMMAPDAGMAEVPMDAGAPAGEDAGAVVPPPVMPDAPEPTPPPGGPEADAGASAADATALSGNSGCGCSVRRLQVGSALPSALVLISLLARRRRR